MRPEREEGRENEDSNRKISYQGQSNSKKTRNFGGARGSKQLKLTKSKGLKTQ